VLVRLTIDMRLENGILICLFMYSGRNKFGIIGNEQDIEDFMGVIRRVSIRTGQKVDQRSWLYVNWWLRGGLLIMIVLG
jgi:hypothetical protein